MGRLRSAVLLVLFQVGPPSAFAQRVVVLQPTVDRGATATIARVRGCAGDGVRDAGATVIGEVDPGTCPSAACVARACEVAGSHGAVRIAIAEQRGSRFVVRAEIFDAAGQSVGHKEEPCAPCRTDDLCVVARSAVADLGGVLRGLLPRTGQLAVRTTPVGAAIVFGEQSLGQAPVEAEVPVGEGIVRATLAQYSPTERAVTIAPGERLDVDLSLSRLPEPGPLWPAIALGVVGAALAGAGGYLAATDGSCAMPTGIGCAEVRRNQPGGIVLLGAGGAAIVGAVVYLLLR